MSTTDVFIALTSIILSVIAFVSATRAATTAKRSEEIRSREAAHKVDAEAYQRAQGIYTEALEQLRRQNISQEEIGLRLSRRIAILEAALHAQGIPLPSDPTGNGPRPRPLRPHRDDAG